MNEEHIESRKSDWSFWVIIIAILIVFLVSAVIFGNLIGTGMGKAAGVAVGSFKGFTEGAAEGRSAGINAGIDSGDVELDISTVITEIGKLEVLVSEFSIFDHLQIGDNPEGKETWSEKLTGKKYEECLKYKGEAIFSVDLEDAVFENRGNNQLVITLPEPEVETNIYDVDKLYEYTDSLFDGNTEEGILIALKSLTDHTEKASEKLSNMDVLMQDAKDSAKTQIKALVNGIDLGQKNIIVQFLSER